MTAASSLRFTGLLLLLVLPFSAVRGDTASGTIPWRSLPHVQRTLGATHHVWDGETICFSNSQNVIRFYPGRRNADVNGTVVWLNAPVKAPSPMAVGDWPPWISTVQMAVLQQTSNGKLSVACSARPWATAVTMRGAVSRSAVKKKICLTSPNGSARS
jgi:hypothetical protein